MDILLSIGQVACLTAAFAALDRAIQAVKLQRPYYAIHVIHNAAIVALTTADIRTSILNPTPAMTHTLPMNWYAVYCCYALHLYHTLLYWRTFRFDDWLHHGLMIGVSLPLGCLASSGPLMGTSLFFTTGLPGGISYAALWLERNGVLSRTTEKAVNRAANVWLRAPGCIFTATLIVQSVLLNPVEWQGVAGLACAALVGWNGLYFMQQAVASAAAATNPNPSA
jgi:hypothetical protein